MQTKKTILVAPLHWGLGHATRCIPIIRVLLKHDYNVLLGSDGAALLLLQKEFPHLKTIELPPYNISYPKNGHYFLWKMLLSLPRIQKTIHEEKRVVKRLIEEGKIQGIISDSRLGVRNLEVPSVFVTHQLNVLSGPTTWLSSKIQQRIIKKFDVCWVPDVQDVLLNLSGRLGHLRRPSFPVSYIGVLSRMKKVEIPKTIHILAILSGPEPQRSALEEKLKKALSQTEQTVVMVQGIVEEKQKWQAWKNIQMVNFMTSEELEETINKSEIVISRSGYTTIMDLTVLEKKAFFIPTPGQYEQEYLAARLKYLGIVPSCRQDKFKLKKLAKVAVYRGLNSLPQPSTNFGELFSLFEGE
ncbi:MAG TPA: glycosyltransferase [Aequorivita sp.]|nr:glycosyltransferase [Aequorivita sp.]